MKIQPGLYLSLAASAALSLQPFSAAGQNTPTLNKPAQPAAPAKAVSVASGPITLPVTVVNDKGDPVKNLTAAGVTLVDNGHPQTIQSFSLAQPAPMII